MPACAVRPKRKTFGFASSGVKSHMAPTADEYQQREYLSRYAEVEEHLESAVHDAAAFDYLVERRGKAEG